MNTLAHCREEEQGESESTLCSVGSVCQLSISVTEHWRKQPMRMKHLFGLMASEL